MEASSNMKPAVFALLMLACWTTTSALLPVHQQLQRRLHALQSSNDALRDAARTKLSRGDFAGAIADFEACGPEDAAARIGLGVATLSTGDHAGSLAHFRAAAALDESSSTAHYNLGLALARGGAPAEAIAPLARAVELEPDDAEFLGALGEAHAADGAHEDAVAAFDRALSLLPDEPSLCYNRANSLADLGRTEAAVEGYRAAVARGGDDAATRLHLGVALHRLERWREAAESLELAGDDVVAKRLLRGLRARLGDGGDDGGGDAAEDAKYAARLFDGYADDFDADLVGKLAYRGPAALVDAVRDDARGWASVLDVGAGTGLLAKELSGALAPGCRVHANDVSRKMLDRAPPGLYSSVALGDAVDVLEAWPDGDLDAVLAADVVGYIRDVGPLLGAARRALGRGGILAFTVEVSHDDGATGAVGALGPGGRYRHDVRGVVDAAAAAGFSPREPAFADLREDGGARVRGAVLVFVRR